MRQGDDSVRKSASMSTPTILQMQRALSADLKKLGTETLVSNALRKTFNTRMHGAVLEFAHKQADPDFWSGVKHYGSGPRSRIRIRRTAVETVAVVKPKARRKAKAEPAATTPQE